MQMQPVSSSNISAIGYESSTRTLRIQFHSGTYDYYDVPESVYQELMSASSHGKYLAAHVKGSYRYANI